MRSKMPLILAGITVVFVVLGMLFTPAPDASAPSTTTRAEAVTVASNPVTTPALAKPKLTPEEVSKQEPDPPGTAEHVSIPAGTKSVEAYWSGKWWPGTVLDHNAGQYRIHIFGDHGKVNATLWLAEHRVRLPESVGPTVSAFAVEGLPE
jgi:hypothetical protein